MLLTDKENVGMKYFIYIISLGNMNIPYIDIDIRKKIWDWANKPPYITLCINNNNFIKLNIIL
jgi:hypothetical protein